MIFQRKWYFLFTWIFHIHWLYHRRTFGRPPPVSFDSVSVFLGSGPKIINARDFQSTDFPGFISWRRLWGRQFLILKLHCRVLQFFLWQWVEMVQTRSRATSPSLQESRDTSSNPHCNRQSAPAPAMQLSSVQHVRSMAATMAKLTR